MKDTLDLFSALGDRLKDFGGDAASRQVAERACRANGWFTPAEVCRAVRTLSRDMLQRPKLERWLAAYPALPAARPLDVLVVMAGNIPLVGFFDLLCVVVAGHRCLVKPSAKDAGIPALLRGHRQSVAVLSGRETEAQLAGLADDIWAYSGLGCRNVSLVFLPEGAELRLRMPAVQAKYRNNYLQTRALLRMQGCPFVDLGAAVAVEQREFPRALSEIAYARYRSADEVAVWLAEHDAELQCVVTETLPHARRADFGRAQSPSLTDYPDNRDVLAWLSAPGV